ncbi:GUN4 domain protein [Rippkaea orientalis PCC 8801]|uniref:GUN4 domain protein n=1 Tax=Rippkaea orientalis (strain PCC 8801 / RF-1) TaxID=41431 RepID=B7K5V9_RIPO1|nr:GUN4 domain-containing protein [Rippkaea orientalis]ACK68012.1 GUN4 domain protein [Rippkaea orientalis PCC 8801]
MSEPGTEIDINSKLAEILTQVQTLNKRVSYLEETIKLLSDVDRYGNLQQLLIAGKFKEADEETTRVILEAVNRTRDNLKPDDMSKFPCSTLRVIDRLWCDYSQNRFGLSIQLSIYLEIGGNLDTLRSQDVAMLEKYGDRVGWRKNGQWQGDNYPNWDFSLSAPIGCFPAIWWKSPYGLKMANFCFMRLISCNLA